MAAWWVHIMFVNLRTMKVKRTRVLILAATMSAMAMGVMAATTVNVTKFYQPYPPTGKAVIEYVVGGTIPQKAVVEITISTREASATFVQSDIGQINGQILDIAASFGGALALTNFTYVVAIVDDLDGVRLWADGPYWAECNVGASKPEEYGYYFYWGDTVGYAPSNETSTAVNYYSDVTWVSSTGELMTNGSPFTVSCPTCYMGNSALQSEGFIDSTGNLVAAHDAATAHLNSPWRLPTDAELSNLASHCTTTWTITNGVSGMLVTGKGYFANRSIFLPAAGFGRESNLVNVGLYGEYWSSRPHLDFSNLAWYLLFIDAGYFNWDYLKRCDGRSVRPVREVAFCSGAVTNDPPPVTETQTTPIPVPYAWLNGYPSLLATHSGDYEAAAKATALNKYAVWACYAVGLNPFDPLDTFRITRFWMDGTVPKFEYNHTTDGSGNSFLPYVKPLGKANLTDSWLPVPDGGNPDFRFFTVEVVPPGMK